MLLERDARIGHLEDVVESHKAANATAKAEMEHLKLLIAKLRRMQFGRSSVKLDRQIEQLELRLEELEADEGAAPIEIPKTPRTAPEQAPRKPLPEHLPGFVQQGRRPVGCTEVGNDGPQAGPDHFNA